MARFAVDSEGLFASMAAYGRPLTAQMQEAAKSVFANETKDGDLFLTATNGFWAAVDGILAFIGLGHLKLAERFGAAADLGQQGADQKTALHVAYNIRQGLVAKGIPSDMAAIMTGDVSNFPEMAGNLYRQFRGQPNGGGPAINPPASSPDLSQLAQNSGNYPVTDNPMVLAQTTPAAGQPTRALTGNTPAA